MKRKNTLHVRLTEYGSDLTDIKCPDKHEKIKEGSEVPRNLNNYYVS
jgi:hypothetical protein